MANSDPRLQWRQLQVASPNVSGLMAQVRGGINDAASAAEGILGRYQEGAELKAENELIRRIGGMDQDQLRTAFNSGAFDDLNLGENGLRTLNEAMGARADIRSTNVNSDRTQASIGWGNDANSRANAAEGRSATRFGWETDEYNRGQAQQDWLENNAGAFFDAERGALTGGTAFSAHIDRTESGGASDQYDTLYGHRNRNNGVRVSQMTLGEAGRFASPDGQYGQSVNAEIGRVATPMGKFQIVGSTLRGLQRDLNLPDDVPFSAPVQEQLGLYLAQQRVMGPRSRESMRAGLRSEWEGFKNVSDAELDVMIDEIRSMPLVNRESILAAAAGGPPATPGQPAAQPFERPRNQDIQTGFGGDAFTAAMAASGQFTPQEILGQVNPLREAGKRGDELIRQQDAATTADLVTGITQNVVSSDGFTPGDAAGAQTAIQEQLLQTGEYSTSEAADLAAAAIANIEADSALNAEFNRGRSTEAQNAVINEALGNAMKQANRGLQGTDQYRALSDIPRYEENPAGSLEADLGIADDPQTPSNYRSEDLRRMVNDLAAHYKVPPAVMAVAMRDAYNPDPGFINGEDTWHGLGWDLTRNSLENRFDRAAVEAAVAQLTPERQAEFDRAQSELTINETRLQQNASQQRQIIGQMNRFEASGNTDDPRYQTLRERLDRLIQDAATISRADGNLEGR